MKKILFIFTLFIGQFIYGQQITSTLNANFYVQGISVNDTFNLEEYFVGVDKVKFFVVNSNNDTIKKSIDADSTNGFTWGLNMGELQPGSLLKAIMFIDGVVEGETIDNFTFTIIAKPEWLINGSATSVEVNGSVLSFEGRYPIQSYEYIVPKKTKLIGNKPLSIAGDFIFHVDYDLTTGEPSVKNNNTEIAIEK